MGIRKFSPRLLLAATSVLIMTMALLLPGTASAQTPQPAGDHPSCSVVPGHETDCWWYVKATQTFDNVPLVGMQAWLTVEKPFVFLGAGGTSFHSLAAMSVTTFANDLVNGVEVGWIVALGVYGNSEPHLFVFPMKDGKQNTECYITPKKCGWVDKGVRHHIGETLQPSSGVEKPFMILLRSDGNWWVNYDNEWVGYFAGTYWGGSFVNGNRLDWYGEVQANKDYGPLCTAMGNGKHGNQAGSAAVGGMGYWTWYSPEYHFNWAHPTQNSNFGNERYYNMGDHLGASWFTYGGIGC